MSSQNFLNPKFGITFEDLYEREGLEKLDKKFTEFVGDQPFDLIGRARVLEDFLAELFGIKKENEILKKSHEDLQKIYVARREFVQRHVAKKFFGQSFDAIMKQIPKQVRDDALKHYPKLGCHPELVSGSALNNDIDDLEKKLAAEILAEKNLEILEIYSAWALYSDAGRKLHKNGALFILPKKIDHQNLISPCEKKSRDGFNLTDQGYSLNRAQGEANYCIFCHKQKKDSCRTGLHEKDSAQFKHDPLAVELHGCPLEEKISEMNLLKSEGFSLAAFAVATIDNPMIAGTGHRICNDCMKSCIYQKQDPVDIPQVETRILKDVLNLPYGFEIYSLLTRWNPLKSEKKISQKNSGKKILVCGLGPAGYTLSHYLLNEGHEVVAIDGLKIEPLNSEISGVDEFGNRQKFRPIKFIDEIYEPLSSRAISGFGGVAEYGITVRFDKNYLKIIRLLLERRKNFRMFGGIRFGSSITDKIAFEQYGSDHVALCIGAGQPNVINIKNNFAKGVRSASDFLMSLQLTGAFKEELFTNLQIRLPIVVIGGGLTAVDSACEAQAYYFTQIKKFSKKIAAIGKEKIFKILNEEEKIIAEEFLRDAEKLARGDVDFPAVKILYRKKLQDSPAYRLNHQELAKAFEEGIEFVENITPLEAEIDEFGCIKNLKCAEGKNFECRSLIVAAGTSPNASLTREDGLEIPLEGAYFKRAEGYRFITKLDSQSGKSVSFFGDLHPEFAGNVVKAMASAKHGSKEISEFLSSHYGFAPAVGRGDGDYHRDFLVTIEKIERLSNFVVKVSVKAPLLARQTEVGHIFRLQNYHAFAPKVSDQLLAMEGVALTVFSIDKERGIISAIVVELGASTKMVKNFKVGEPCIFLGPSGHRSEVLKNKTVVLVGGGRGNQPLISIARDYKANGCKVIFFAGYHKNSYIVLKDELDDCCDVVIYAIEKEEPNLALKRDTDCQFYGNLVDAMCDYFAKNPQKIDHILTMGMNRMMAEVARLRSAKTIPCISEATTALASLNSPMQCMMKGVCSQCLQKRVGKNGEEEFFYSCSTQDVDMDSLNFQHLHWRCEQNSLSEKVARLWLEFLEQN